MRTFSRFRYPPLGYKPPGNLVINTAHPLAQSIIAAYLFNSECPEKLNYGIRYPGASTHPGDLTRTSLAGFEAGPCGYGGHIPINDNQGFNTHITINNSLGETNLKVNDWSALISFSIDSTPTDDRGLFSLIGDNNPHVWMGHQDLNDKGWKVCCDSNWNSPRGVTTVDPELGSLATMVGTWNNSDVEGTNRSIAYTSWAGEFEENISSFKDGDTSSGNTIDWGLGRIGGTFGEGLDGHIYMAVFFRAEIRPAMARSLAANPWQLVKPANDSIFIPFSPATGEIVVPAGNLVLSSVAPGVEVSTAADITVPQGDLALSTFAPTVSVSTGANITVPQGDLVFSTSAPDVTSDENVTRIIPQGDLALSSTAPTVEKTENRDIAVPQGDLTFSTTSPTVQVAINRVVPQADLVLSTTAPLVEVAQLVSITVPQGDLALSTFAPGVVVGGPAAVTVPQGDLALTGFAPTSVNSGDLWIEAGEVSTVWTETGTP